MKQLVASVVCALVGSAVWAAATNVAFPVTGGDFASAADWSGTAVTDPAHASGYQLQIGYNGTYYISSDIDFASLLVDPWGSQITIDCLEKATGRPKIQLNNNTASGVTRGSLLMNGSSGGYLTIKGGDWNLGGGKILFKVRSSHSYEYNTITITNNAVITNAGNIAIYKAAHQQFDIVGHSAVYAASVYVGTGSPQCNMKVADGGYFHIADGGMDIPGAYDGGETYEGADYCEMLVTGTGSRVYGASPRNGQKFQVGAGLVPGRLVVTDGARFVSDYPENYLGAHTNTHQNVIRVENGGSLFMANILYMSFKPFNGYGARWRGYPQDASNRLEVVNGGVYTNASLVSVQYAGNALVVSNATAAITRLNVQGTNNCVVLQGTNPKLKINYDNEATYVSGKTTRSMISWLNDKTKLRFELPPEGYEDGYVPMEVNRTFALYGDSALEIEGADAFLSNFRKGRVCRKTLTLIRCTDGTLDISADKIAAAQAKLPKGCKLKLKDNSLQLSISVGGLMLLFR